MCAKMYTRERSGVEKTGTQELRDWELYYKMYLIKCIFYY